MYNCVIVDDEIVAITQLKRLLQDHTNIYVHKTFTNSEEALQHILENEVDICFLDIKIPKLNGIDLGKLIINKTNIIYTTSSTKFAFDSYLVGATDYLLKPVLKDKLERALEKTIKQIEAYKLLADNELMNKENDKFITVIASRKSYRINLTDLMYVESKKEYLYYHSNKLKLLSLGSLKECLETLDNKSFFRIHKTYIVNWQFVQSYSATEVILINGKILPIGRAYRSEIPNASFSLE